MNKERARAKMREKGMKGKGERRKETKKVRAGARTLFYIRQTWRMQEGRLEPQALLDLGNAGFRLGGAALVVGTGERFADLGLDRDLEVELDLRLGTRRTYADLQAAFGEVLQHIARRVQRHFDVALFPLAVLEFALLEGLIVLDEAYLLAGDLFRSVSAVVLHHLLDLLGTCLTRANDIDRRLALEAVVGVDLQQVVVQRHAVVLRVRSDLADQADRGRRTFITDSVVRQEAETLLASTDILTLAFPHTDAVGDPLEAGVLIRQRHALSIRDLTDELRGHDGLDDIHVRTHLTQPLHVVDDVVVEHDVGLVSVDNHPLALVVAADDGYTVRIRVGSDNEVGAQLRA